MQPMRILQGSVPGMIVTKSTGLPGTDYDFVIRNGTNPSAGASTPLIVINGVPIIPDSDLTELKTLSLEDIDSIEVLKNLAETAQYGGFGADGVIRITTRQPSKIQPL